jgi:hypothetical protein
LSPRKRAPARPPAGPQGPFAVGRFIRNLLLWMAPLAVVWVLSTPAYNVFLMHAAGNAIRLTESPNRTTLVMHDDHNALIYRSDLRGDTSTGHVSSMRLTSYHFPVLFMTAMFLAMPGLRLEQRLEPLGYALIVSACFHIVAVVFRLKSIYATQLGAWSAEHYGSFAQNFWGLGKHLLDLPFRFALPLLLWAVFFFDRLMPPAETGDDA